MQRIVEAHCGNSTQQCGSSATTSRVLSGRWSRATAELIPTDKASADARSAFLTFGELRVARSDFRSTFRSDAYALSKILHGLENSLHVLDPFAEGSFKEHCALFQTFPTAASSY